jgi:hypothetical protein
MMQNRKKMSKNLGKEILGLFLLFLSIKIILPIIKLMDFKLMAREVTATFKVLTIVSSLIRERIVKYKGDKDLFYLEGQVDKHNLWILVVHGYYTVTGKYLLRMEVEILMYEVEALGNVVYRFLTSPANIPFVGPEGSARVEVAEVFKAAGDCEREVRKWDKIRSW